MDFSFSAPFSWLCQGEDVAFSRALRAMALSRPRRRVDHYGVDASISMIMLSDTFVSLFRRIALSRWQTWRGTAAKGWM